MKGEINLPLFNQTGRKYKIRLDIKRKTKQFSYLRPAQSGMPRKWLRVTATTPVYETDTVSQGVKTAFGLNILLLIVSEAVSQVKSQGLFRPHYTGFKCRGTAGQGVKRRSPTAAVSASSFTTTTLSRLRVQCGASTICSIIRM